MTIKSLRQINIENINIILKINWGILIGQVSLDIFLFFNTYTKPTPPSRDSWIINKFQREIFVLLLSVPRRYIGRV